MNYQPNGTPRFCTAAVVALGVSALLGGCASIPDVTIKYRPVKWALLVTVAHTITCNQEKSQAMVDRGAVFLPLYSAATSDTRFQIQLKDLDRYAADADISIVLTDDGRLKSINHSTTGQGEATVKGVVGVAAAFSAQSPAVRLAAPPAVGVQFFRDNAFQTLQKSAVPAKVCAVVENYRVSAPKELAQVSLVQTALIRPDSGNPIEAKPPSKNQEELLEELKKAGIDLKTKVITQLADDELQPIVRPRSTVVSSEVPVTLQRMRSFIAKAEDAEGTIGSKSVPVPTEDVFVLPIPKAALFGKQTFSLALADSGRITNIGYGRTTGAPGALGAITAFAGADVTEDTAEAAALKVASDLIAQQQRYNNCRLKPSDCK